jgi:hypothetical protein
MKAIGKKKFKEKTPNLVYEVAVDMHFGHKHTNREFWVTKFPQARVLVTMSW